MFRVLVIILISLINVISFNKSFDFRLPLAGGISGGLANALLYPLDTIKTVKQSNPNIRSSWEAFEVVRKKGILRAYSGIVPAVLGAIPSSAVYFGTYETSKRLLTDFSMRFNGKIARPFIHMSSAALGNIFSSVLFVPKEVIKQNMQVIRTGALTAGLTSVKSGTWDVTKEIFRNKGIQGFYSGYFATLSRNIPSAVIRFTLYEELRLILRRTPLFDTAAYVLAGAVASASSSALTTPFDVIKTRMATRVLSSGREGGGVWLVMREIVHKEGMAGLFSGAQPRILWSALFGGVGFACFETLKNVFDIADEYGGEGVGTGGRIGGTSRLIDDDDDKEEDEDEEDGGYYSTNRRPLRVPSLRDLKGFWDRSLRGFRRSPQKPSMKCPSCTLKFGCQPQLMKTGIRSGL